MKGALVKVLGEVMCHLRRSIPGTPVTKQEPGRPRRPFLSAASSVLVEADHPDVDQRIAAGDLGVVLGWMREHVHRRGYLEESEDTVRRATGHGLEVQPLIRYLRSRRGPLYGLA